MKKSKLIYERRMAKKLTQEKLGKKLSVSNKTISKWETGKGLPSVDMLMSICDILDIELKELLTGEKDSKYEEVLIEELKLSERKLKKKNRIIE